MNKYTLINYKELIVFTILQIILIRFVAVPVVKKAIIATFNENGIMCTYDESKNS